MSNDLNFINSRKFTPEEIRRAFEAAFRIKKGNDMSEAGKFMRSIQGGYMFRCPGCDCLHAVYTEPTASNVPGRNYPIWGFNGNFEAPTFTPSVLVKFGPGFNHVCHIFVRDGNIQFLGDCTHKLAGQTVPMIAWDREEKDPENIDPEDIAKP